MTSTTPPRHSNGSSTPAASSQSTQDARLPGAFRLGWLRGGIELKQFFQEKEQVVFTFSLPAVLLCLFASIFHGTLDGTDINQSQLYVASMLGAGVMSVSFQSLGMGIAHERDEGTLRRLSGMPMPRSSYFLGKLWLVLVSAVAESVVLLAVGVAFFGLTLPSSAQKWFTFGWVLLLGLIGCSLLGIAVSGLARTGQSAIAVVTLPFLVLQFMSGVYIPISQISGWMATVGAFFPLKWMCQGLRGVFLPEHAKAFEQAGAWEYDRIALVLGAWCIGGLLLCLMTFRWKSRHER